MTLRLLAATDDGVELVELHDDPDELHLARCARALPGVRVRAVACAPDGLAIAGTDTDGAVVSTDRGCTWRHVGDDVIEPDRITAVATGPGLPGDGTRLYVGTEPSRLYVSDDGGESWRELDALQRIPSRDEWSFPPRPWTHHVRAIAPHPTDPDLLLVGIELGGLMRSTDGGASFQDHRPGAHRDVHALAWEPSGAACVEAGGTGTARSDDPAGAPWHDASDGLEERYAWSVAVAPDVPGRWYAAAAPGPRCAHVDDVDARALVARRDEPGSGSTGLARGAWTRIDPAASDGVRGTRLHAMPYDIVAPRGGSFELVAGLRDGTILARCREGGRWQRADPALAPITALALAST